MVLAARKASRPLLSADRERRTSVQGPGRVRRWTNPQMEFFRSPFRVTVWRGSNGIGKTTTMAELTRRALGKELDWQASHPDPPVVGLFGNTWKQLGETLGHFWAMVDRRWFRKGIRFESGVLKGQRTMVFDIVDGPGKGGQLHIGVFDPENAAGPRYNVVISDEPLPEPMYGELWPRLLGRDGRLYMGFTVTLKTAGKVAYLERMVNDKTMPWVGEVVTPLTLDAVTPRGGPIEIPWISQQEIDQFIAGLPEIERAMRTGTSWIPAKGVSFFSAFGPHLVRDFTVPAGMMLGVGIDHGSRPGAQRAVLIAVDSGSIHSRVYVVDEYKGDGRTESEEDARGILRMLERNGFHPKHIDLWMGDRAHDGSKGGGIKSNLRLRRAIAAAMGVDISEPNWSFNLPEPLRKMRVPRKYDGSMFDGAAILHDLMLGADPRIVFHPCTTELQSDLGRWEGNIRDPAKDGIDALRYIVVPMVEGIRR